MNSRIERGRKSRSKSGRTRISLRQHSFPSTPGTVLEAKEKVAVASRNRPSAAKAGSVFNQIRDGLRLAASR
jgi:hypothetical protein